jgi:hypothetical protein
MALTQSSGDVHPTDATPAVQRSPTSCGDAHPAGESIDEKYWYLPAFDKTVVAFLKSYGRLPMETKSKDAKERQLAQQIRKRKCQLHTDTRELLDALEDPAGSTALARFDLERPASHSTDSPDDLVRKLEVMTQIPSPCVPLESSGDAHPTAATSTLPEPVAAPFPVGDEGEVDDSDVAQLAGLPWRFEEVSGELKDFVADISGSIAQAHDFHADALVFEECFGRDVRFLHQHNHIHECSGTCVKNVKKKTKEELVKMIKANRAPPCRFEF